MGPYLRRHVDDVLDAVLEGLSAVMLTGPRACGKTTTGARRAASIIRLDDENQARAFADAPDVVLASHSTPVLVDEWQEVPASLAAVKRAVDAADGGGRFLVTGSVRARMASSAWPGTGRVVPLPMYGLTQSEAEGGDRPVDVLEVLFADADPPSLPPAAAPDLAEYVARALRGSFPEAIAMSEVERAYWYPGYVDQLIHRDVTPLAEVRAPARLGALLEAVAATTAGTPTMRTLTEAAGLNGRTATSYLDLLVDLRVVERVPAWHSNRLQRLIKAPKLYLADTGMVGHLVGADIGTVLSNGDLLGRLIENFVVMQLLPLVGLSAPRMRAFHLRDGNGSREVDLLLEGPAGRLVAIEIKSRSSASRSDARHLAWLRDAVGDDFHRGVVLHTGRETMPLGDRLWAMPIASLWHQGVH